MASEAANEAISYKQNRIGSLSRPAKTMVAGTEKRMKPVLAKLRIFDSVRRLNSPQNDRVDDRWSDSDCNRGRTASHWRWMTDQ
jgi:hypothetical protein